MGIILSAIIAYYFYKLAESTNNSWLTYCIIGVAAFWVGGALWSGISSLLGFTSFLSMGIGILFTVGCSVAAYRYLKNKGGNPHSKSSGNDLIDL